MLSLVAAFGFGAFLGLRLDVTPSHLVEGLVSRIVKSSAEAPHHFVSTLPAAPVRRGNNTIEVASIVGLAIGDTIKIGTEYNMIKGYSSIILDHPMNNDIASGADVTVVHEPANAQVQNASTTAMMRPIPLGKVLGSDNLGTPPPIPAKAAEILAPTEKNGDVTTLFCVLLGGGLSVCCFLFCIVAFCAIIIMLTENRLREQRDAEQKMKEKLCAARDAVELVDSLLYEFECLLYGPEGSIDELHRARWGTPPPGANEICCLSPGEKVLSPGEKVHNAKAMAEEAGAGVCKLLQLWDEGEAKENTTAVKAKANKDGTIVAAKKMEDATGQAPRIERIPLSARNISF